MSKYSNVLVFSIALLLLHPVPVMAAGQAPGPALKNPTISGGTITAADVSGANLAANNVTQTASAWMGYLSGTADPYPINLSNSLTVHLPSGSYIYATPMPSATNPATLTNISGIGQSNFLTIWTPAFSGGSPGAVASNDQHQTVIYGAPNSYIWNGLDQLNFAGTGGTGQHVARYAQTLRTTYASGGAAHNPELWAGVGEYRDWTGQKSSLTGAGLAWEFDNFGNNVDDAHNRQGIVVVVGNAINPGVAIPNEVNTAISVYTAPYAQAKSMVALGGNYQTAAIDTRYAVGNGTAGAGPAAPTVTTSSSGVSVAVSNVMPFTSDFRGRDVNNGYPATIKIGNGQYTETAYALRVRGRAER